MSLQAIIEAAFERRADITPKTVMLKHVQQLSKLLKDR